MFSQSHPVNIRNTEVLKRVMVNNYHLELKKGNLSRLWARLIRRPQKLLRLHDAAAFRGVLTRHYAGLQTIAIDEIKGSESRSSEFDANFRPLASLRRQRWIDMAVAWAKGTPMPPVTLIQFGETYFVRDGHHRISVAKNFGQQFIEAEVTIWQPEALATKAITPAEKPMVSCRPVDCQSQAVCQC